MIIKSIFKITRISKIILWLGIWHVVYYFLKKPKRLLWIAFTAPLWISVIGFAIEYYNANQENEVMSSPPDINISSNISTTKQPANATKENPHDPKIIMKNSSNIDLIPKFVGRIEDGASAFNTPISSTMSVHDYNFYASHFRYVMSNFPADKQYKWLINDDFYGYFEAQKKFKAPSGVICREFQEITHYNGKNQGFSGVACARGDGGWCKLRRKSSLNCKIGHSSPTSIFWRNKINGIFSGI